MILCLVPVSIRQTHPVEGLSHDASAIPSRLASILLMVRLDARRFNESRYSGSC